MKPTTIYLATDHAGFELKNEIKVWLEESGHAVTDCGAHTFDALDDFPDYIQLAAKAVAKSPQSARAIIFGGSGQGEAMQANRFKHVRATVYYGGPHEIVSLGRQHNDANVLSLGARFVDATLAKQVISQWLESEPLADEKYHRRNVKLDRLHSDDEPLA